MRHLIDWYIKKETWTDIEEYKWEAFKKFKDCFYLKKPIDTRIEEAFSKADNLLDSKRYFPFGMFKIVIPHYPFLLNELFNENNPLKSRIINYQKGFRDAVEKMKKKEYNGWKKNDNISTYQDVRAISVYLAMRYPEKYYIYKYGIYRDFAKLINHHIKQNNPIERMLGYFELCDEVKCYLLKNKDLIEKYTKWLNNNKYLDSEYYLLTQDFIYSVVCHRTQYSLHQKVIHMNSKDIINEIEKHIVSNKGRKIDYAKRDERYRSLGKEGELWVMEYEKERVKDNEVIHVSNNEGDGAGYDILSREDDGVTPRYIEVKTTTGGIDTPFYFSDNELRFSEENKRNYYLYRLYNFGKQTSLAIIHGSLADVKAKPVSFKCIVTKSNQ